MQKAELETHRDLDIPGLLPRRVDVWLPEAYRENPGQRFPVLYLHDGQMVFTFARSKGGGWNIHQAISHLVDEGNICPVIVVAVPSTLNRLYEYLPSKVLDYPAGMETFQNILRSEIGDSKRELSGKFIHWMADTVKPAIDQRYRTLPEMEHTAVMGSSMGAMVSLYMLCEFPEVFSKAACLSTHWPILGDGMIAYLEESLPEQGRHKLYFDHGSEGLDSEYAPWQAKVDALLREKGYREGKDFASWSFPGEAHTPRAWAGRVHIPLTFLFGTIDR